MNNIRKKQVFAVAASVVVAGTMVYAIQKHNSVKAEATQNGPTVSVAPVVSGSTEMDVMAQGVILPGGAANVSVLPGFTARVEQCFVNVGDRVKAGQVLATLDTSAQVNAMQKADLSMESANAQYQLNTHPFRTEEYAQMKNRLETARLAVTTAENNLSLLKQGPRPENVHNAELTVQNAQAKLAIVQKNHDRDKALFAKDLISRQDMDASDAGLLVAQDALEQAQGKLSVLYQGALPEEIANSETALQDAKLRLVNAQGSFQMMSQGPRPEQREILANTLQEAKLTKAQAQLMFDRRNVTAPISGVIVARNIAPGELATSGAGRTSETAALSDKGSSMFLIADDTNVQFLANVDQKFYHSVKVGQPASVGIEALPGRTFSGKVSRISALIHPDRTSANGNFNPATALTFNIWISVPNSNHDIVSGETGLTTLTRKQSGVVVPQSALSSFKLGEGLVYVVQNGIVHLRSVKYDGSTDGSVRVLSGLRTGEKVVVSDTSSLMDGMKVQPVAAAPDANSSYPM